MSAFNKQTKKNPNEETDSDEETPKVEVAAEPEPEEDTSCASPAVVTKYQEAAKIANAALDEITKACVAGAKTVELVRVGESTINKLSALIYRAKVKGKAVDKGSAFPVCISINECVCHNNPMDSDEEEEIKNGDMVKVDLGVHIDGYIAVLAHTIHVGYTAPAAPVTGDLANCYGAAFTAAKVAAGLIRPGNKNTQVTKAVKEITEAYGCKSISGTLMHQVKRFVMDGNKMILLRDEPEQKVPECTFEENEVFVVDIAMTTGAGTPREKDKKPTIYKRVVERKYGLKNKSSRMFFSEVIRRFPTLPFTVRAFEDASAARLGMRECIGHELIVPYPILYEKPGNEIVHYKFTVMILPGGNTKITGVNFDCPAGYASTEGFDKLSDEIKAIVTAEDEKAAKKAAKKAKKAAAKKA